MTRHPERPAAMRRTQQSAEPAARPARCRPGHDRPGHDRRGTVIVVVIALLGALMLIGFLFLTLTLQEEESARYFKASEKTQEVDPNVYFNWALEQLIAGPADQNRESVLWGARGSLLATMVGGDLIPYDGQGVNLVWDAGANGGRPEPDLNRDGIPDINGQNTGDRSNDGAMARLNLSPGSQPEVVGQPNVVKVFLRSLRDKVDASDPLGLPAPDAPYTAADHNSPFLSFDYVEPVTGRRVILPSFHRPQLLRNRVSDGDYTLAPAAYDTVGDPAGTTTLHPWLHSTATLPYVLAPHLQRRATAIDPENPGTNFEVLTAASPATRRFITGAHDFGAGSNVGFPDYAVVDANGFLDADGALGPVSPLDPTFVPPLNLSIDREPFLRAGLGDNPGAATSAQYVYPADPDNDGVFDAIYLDLGFPVQTDADGVRKFVPMTAFKVVDGDALFNLNAHGNTYGRIADADGNGLDDSRDLYSDNFFEVPRGPGQQSPVEPEMLSRSDHGLGPHEVNPQPGLSGAIHDDFAPADHEETFEAFDAFYDYLLDDPGTDAREPTWADAGGAAGRQQSRNLEWWFLTHGRATLKDNPRGAGRAADQAFPGLYGESVRVAAGAEKIAADDFSPGPPRGPYPLGYPRTDAAAFFPYPGVSGLPSNVAQGRGADGDDDGDLFAGTRHALPGLIFGNFAPFRKDSAGLPAPGLAMVAPADGVPLDRRGSGTWVNGAGLAGLFLADLNPTGGTDPAAGVRSRFPALADAILPLYLDAPTPLGFREQVGGTFFPIVGAWQQVSAALGGLELASENRTDENGSLPAAAGGLAGVATAPVPVSDPTTTVNAMSPQDAFAGVGTGPNGAARLAGASLYGALIGAAESDHWQQYNRLQIDDPDETVADYRRSNGQRSDALFGPAEFAGLHASDRDRAVRQDLPDRLYNLVPLSFRHAANAEAVRRRFTTVSFDVATAAAPFEPDDARRSPGGDDRAWERTNVDGLVDEPPPATGPRRVLPNKVFPPVFYTTMMTKVPAQLDPFRPELRAALVSGVYDRIPADDPATKNVDEEQAARRNARSLVRKMSLNGVLERVTNPRDPLFDAAADYVRERDGDRDLDNDGAADLGYGEIRVRPLTPHPAGLPAGPFDPPDGHPLSANDYFDKEVNPNLNNERPRFGVSDAELQASLFVAATDTFQPQGRGALTWDFPQTINPADYQRALELQEWHARRDRQNLARDIYVLLYTLGGVDNTTPGFDYRVGGVPAVLAGPAAGDGPVRRQRRGRDGRRLRPDAVRLRQEPRRRRRHPEHRVHPAGRRARRPAGPDRRGPRPGGGRGAAGLRALRGPREYLLDEEEEPERPRDVRGPPPHGVERRADARLRVRGARLHRPRDLRLRGERRPRRRRPAEPARRELPRRAPRTGQPAAVHRGRGRRDRQPRDPHEGPGGGPAGRRRRRGPAVLHPGLRGPYLRHRQRVSDR